MGVNPGSVCRKRLDGAREVVREAGEGVAALDVGGPLPGEVVYIHIDAKAQEVLAALPGKIIG